MPTYDYRSAGAYFVTIVTADRACLFAGPPLSRLAERCWLALPQHFAHVALDAWVLMPNHIHGVIVFQRGPDECDDNDAPRRTSVQPGSLGAVVGNFKSVTTRRINRLRRTPAAPVWQRNYYERVIRDEAELHRVRDYIAVNPLRWTLDRENPDRSDYADDWTPVEDDWFGRGAPDGS